LRLSIPDQRSLARGTTLVLDCAMSSFELNKIAAAILMAGIFVMSVSLISDLLISPKKLTQNAYVIEGVASAAPAAAEAPPPDEAIPPISPLLQTASAAEGEGVAKACAACHSFTKGGAAKVGPNLWGVIGGPAASAAGYSYSASLQKMAGKEWDYEEMNKFIANPKGYAAGTKMTYAGLRKPEQRAAVIAYLRTMSDSPKPMP
jgi:cytochrome c